MLDLFHATQRLTKTIIKTHPFQSKCVRDCSLIFRRNDDQANERKLETASKEVILKKLDEFSRKWKRISETSADGPLLRDSFDQQVKNLRKHVALGCLSEIPPSYSTSINESLHQKINDLYAGVKMGPELAFALLTMFFHAWNSRRRNVIKGVPIIEPLSTETKRKCESVAQNKEFFGIGGKTSNSNICSNEIGHDSSHSAEQLYASFRRAMSMLKLQNIINQLSNNGSGLRADDLFFHNDILKYVFKGGKCVTSTVGNVSNKDQLEGTVAQFGMEIVSMAPDGNCFFSAVAFSIAQNKSDLHKALGVYSYDTVEAISKKLRQQATAELRMNKEKYLPFLHNVLEKEYDDMVTDFQRPGVFAGDMGDVIVKSTANILKTPLVILTNISNHKVITVTPDEFHDGNYSIFLTYTRDGPGHYDALVRRDGESTNRGELEMTSAVNSEEITSCTCGMSRSKTQLSCANKKDETGKTYRSRCPCLRKNKACTNSCKCKGCGNPHGIRVYESLIERNRQRAPSDLDGERKDGTSYLLSKNEEVAHGKWTDEENFIFLQYITTHPSVFEENNSIEMAMNVEELTRNINSTMMEMGIIKSGLGHL